MLRMRLQRVGRKNQPSFRVVVLDGRKGPKSGRVIERVGFYNPITKEKNIESERATHWLGVGAQPSDTVYNMLVDAGVVSGKKRNALPRKRPIVKEEKEEEQKTEGGAETSETPEADENAEEKTTEETATEETSAEAPEEEVEEGGKEPEQVAEKTED